MRPAGIGTWPGSEAGRGASPLHIENHHRYFHDAGHTDGLCHQGKATPGGAAHGPRPGQAGSNSHIDNRQLVLSLLHRYPQFFVTGHQPV